MVTKEERLLEPIYLRHHDYYQYICEYYPQTGACIEKLTKDLNNIQFSKGFYTTIDNNFIGIYPTFKGPVIFKDKNKYLLNQGNYKILIDQNEIENIFKLEINHDVKILINYSKTKYVNFDVWSDEENVDFFLWLYKNQNKDDFHAYYQI